MSLTSKRNFKSLFCAFLIAFFVGCSGYEHDTIPTVLVDFTIYPNDITHQNLNHYGGYEYYTGGVAGILIYRLNDWSFCVYDRACPHDWQSASGWIWVDESGLTASCKSCSTMFNILDGSVISGPSRFPLKYYRYSFDGVIMRVRN